MKFKNIKGAAVTEFILILPWFCLVFLCVITFMLLSIRLQLVAYSTFMAGRVYGIWPEEMREKMVSVQLHALLPRTVTSAKVSDDILKVDSVMAAPFAFPVLGKSRHLGASIPIVTEPIGKCFMANEGGCLK